MSLLGKLGFVIAERCFDVGGYGALSSVLCQSGCVALVLACSAACIAFRGESAQRSRKIERFRQAAQTAALGMCCVHFFLPCFAQTLPFKQYFVDGVHLTAQNSITGVAVLACIGFAVLSHIVSACTDSHQNNGL
jgi:hypothetical protein